MPTYPPTSSRKISPKVENTATSHAHRIAHAPHVVAAAPSTDRARLTIADFDRCSCVQVGGWCRGMHIGRGAYRPSDTCRRHRHDMTDMWVSKSPSPRPSEGRPQRARNTCGAGRHRTRHSHGLFDVAVFCFGHTNDFVNTIRTIRLYTRSARQRECETTYPPPPPSLRGGIVVRVGEVRCTIQLNQKCETTHPPLQRGVVVRVGEVQDVVDAHADDRGQALCVRAVVCVRVGEMQDVVDALMYWYIYTDVLTEMLTD